MLVSAFYDFFSSFYEGARSLSVRAKTYFLKSEAKAKDITEIKK